MLVLTILCALGCSGAMARSVAPSAGASSQDSVAVPAPVTVTGTIALRISLTRSGGVEARVVPGTQSGKLLPVVTGAPSLDAATRTISLAVGLQNTGRLRIHAPTSVSVSVPAASGGVTLSSPGVAQSNGSLRVPLPAAALGVTQVPGDSSTSFVGAGATTEPVTVRVALPHGQTAITITVRGLGTVIYGIGMRAPRTVPDSIQVQAKANAFVSNGTKHRIVRNLIWLVFAKTASLEDRQAAVDTVNGIVVGGSPIGAPNNYLVQIPVAVSAGSGPLLHAIGVLKQMPHVRFAMVDDLDPLTTEFQRPKDGTGFTSWQLVRSAATGSNWGEEAVDAPFAWGCSTGSQTENTVAIVDANVFKISDLSANLSTTYFESGTDTTAHGTMIASIIGAVGNNSSGMTGMLWNTQLGFFNTAKPDGNVATDQWLALERAGVAGFPVINISLGLNWGGLQPVNDSANNAEVAGVTGHFELAIDSIRSAGRMPLFVISAGNDGIDAYWNGTPDAKNDSDYARQILVVASNDNNSSPTGTLSSTSNRGILVDIAAPGGSVTVLVKNGAMQTQSGTSLATPFVAGAAGQLVAFDTVLSSDNSFATVDSLRSYIMKGAADGARTAGGYYILDSYDALKRAARRHGAPFCGNVLFADSVNNVWVIRNQATEDMELLLTNQQYPPLAMFAAHGGHLLATELYYDGYGSYSGALQYTTSWPTSYTLNTWPTSPLLNPPENLTAWSPNEITPSLFGGVDHDGVHSAKVQASANQDTLYLTFWTGGNGQPTSTWPIITDGGHIPINPIWPLVAFNPLGTVATVTFNVWQDDTNYTTYIYKAPWNSKPKQIGTLSNTDIWGWGVAEDGSGYYVSSNVGHAGDSGVTCAFGFWDTSFASPQWEIVQSYSQCELRQFDGTAAKLVRRWTPPRRTLDQALKGK
jgi:hypothetical protein